MSTGPARPESGHVRKLVENGFGALSRGDLSAATVFCRQALQSQPKLARAHYLAANIALESGHRSTAKRALEQVVALNPKYAAAWAHLAQIAITSGEFLKAEGCLANAINTESGNPAVQDLIGKVFRHAGSLSSSRQWHELAAAGDDRNPAFLINLAMSHRYFGESEKALRLLRRCIDLQPDHAQAHWLYASTCTAKDERHINEMRKLLGAQSHPRSVAYLEYAQAKELEDLQRWPEAGEAIARGAAARRTTVAFDEDAEQALFERIAELFTGPWLKQNTATRKDQGPVFIVGEPRTGTTLLDRLLSAHSEIGSAGELRHLGFAARRISGMDEPRQFTSELMQVLSDADMRALGDAYLASTRSLYTKRLLIDKLPANYLYLPAILAALPSAKIIHVRRQPLDACFAVYKQHFADAYLYSYDQEETARHFVRYDALMKTWNERFPGRFITVQYEDLARDTEATLRQLFEYIGVPWEAACLNIQNRTDGIATASSMQVQEAPHSRSIGKWRHFEEQLLPMTRVLQMAGLV